MIDWRRTVAYAFLAVVFLGFCLYVAFNLLIFVAPPQLVWGSEGSYHVSEMLPRYFWTEICFIVVSVGLGLYMGLHIIVKKRWKILVYSLAPAFLLAFFQNVTFVFLSVNAPTIAGVGTTSLEGALGSFYVGTCAPILFCFVVASIGLGHYIGTRETRKAILQNQYDRVFPKKSAFSPQLHKLYHGE